MLNFTNLHYFLVTAEELNISHAAARLYISQQALSNHIRHLEDDLGTALFVRAPRLQLTYAGTRLQEVGRQMLDLKDQLVAEINDINNDTRGKLSIGISYTRGRLILPRVLPLFNQKYPRYDISLLEGSSSELIRLLLRKEADVVITFYPAAARNDLLEAIDLQHERLFLVVPRKFLFQLFGDRAEDKISQFQDDVDIRELQTCPFILIKGGHRVRKTIDEHFAKLGVQPTVLLETNNLETSLELANCGMGIAVLPEMFVQNMTSSARPEQQRPVELFPLTDTETSGTLAALYLKNHYLSNAGKYFISICTQLGQQPGAEQPADFVLPSVGAEQDPSPAPQHDRK